MSTLPATSHDKLIDRRAAQPDPRDVDGLGAPRSTVLAWWLITLVVVARVVSFVFLKADSAQTLVPRSFVGGGFQTGPAMLDLAAPLVAIFALFSRRRFFDNGARRWTSAIADAITFLLFPLVTGLAMFAFEERWQVAPNVAVASLLRWLQFVIAYLAWNLLLDEVRGRWQRFAAVPLLAVSLGVLQDVYSGLPNAANMILFSVGLTLTWTVFALRRRYCDSPFEATAAAAVIGGVCCLLVVMAPSNSAILFFVGVLALPAGAIALRRRRGWAKWAWLAGTAVFGLTLSVIVPRFLTPEHRGMLLTVEPPPAHTEQVEGITIRYDEVAVRDIARRLAHVLAAANQVSRVAYGISPEVNELVIRGFAPGGFHAEFPHAIVGNLASQRQVDLSLDGAFLNSNPNATVDFPDPVNGILHEYSHLYGMVRYTPWVMGPEEEGWATFSATRLAHRLYERFGAELWSPAYDYARRADAITRVNLGGRAVWWSHANEFGGFRMWQGVSEKQGETSLYRTRWELTRRDGRGWWLQVSVPGEARKAAEHFGLENFASASASNAVPYSRIYSLKEVQTAGEWVGITAEQSKTMYERRATAPVDPTVRVPAAKPARMDVVLSLCSLLLVVVVRRR